MQNPIAFLSVPAPVGEAFTAPTVEAGDGSFAEAFTEAVVASDAEPRPEEAAGSVCGGPIIWAVPLPLSKLFVGPPGSGAVDGPNGERMADSLALDEGLQQMAGDAEGSLLTPPWTDVAPVPAKPAGEPMPTASRTHDAGNAMVGRVQPPPFAMDVQTATDSLPVAFADEASAHLIASIPAREGSFPPATTAEPDVMDQPSEQPLWNFNARQVTAKLPVAAIENDQVRTADNIAPVPASSSAKTQPGPVGETGIQGGALFTPMSQWPANLQPPNPQGGLSWTEIAQDQPEPAPATSSGHTRGHELLHEDVALDDVKVPGDPLGEQKAVPDKPALSFWERFYTDKVQPVPPTPDPEGGDVLDATVEAVKQSTTFEADDGSVSPAELSAADKTRDGAPSTNGSGVDRRDQRVDFAPPESPEVRSTDLSDAAPRWLFSEWNGDLVLHGRRSQGSETSASPGTHASSGTSTTAHTQQSLPVPQIAAQLTGVLVRNASTVTELALAPEELGRVKLRMEPEAGNPDRMMILISAERPETLDLFRRHAGELADAIRNAGYSGADIGFGQSGREGGSDQRKDPSPFASGLPFDDTDPSATTPMLSAGTSLDLRL